MTKKDRSRDKRRKKNKREENGCKKINEAKTRDAWKILKENKKI